MSTAVTSGQARISGPQSRSLIGSFTVDTPWDDIDADVQPFIELTPKERGERFAVFLTNGCRVNTAELFVSIDRSSFNPETFIGKGWSIWKGPAGGDGLTGEEDQDKQSLALSSVDIGKVLFEHTLKSGETSVKGEVKLERLQKAKRIRLDAKFGQILWEEPGRRTLELLRIQRGITWFDLLGTVLRNPDGRRCVLYFYWHEGRWGWDYCWLGHGWRVSDPSAVLAS